MTFREPPLLTSFARVGVISVTGFRLDGGC